LPLSIRGQHHDEADEALIRCDVAERLREAGYTVVETASGKEAIAMCKSDVSIDIVFTHIHLIGPAVWMWLNVFERIARTSHFIRRGNRLIVDVAFRTALFWPSHISTTIVNACDRLRTKWPFWVKVGLRAMSASLPLSSP
jgi:CheY-like chemotaxis protein